MLRFILISVSSLLANDVITARVTVAEGDSVTIYTNVTTTQQDEILWYFNDIRIAVITGDLSRICTDVQCNEGTERFRDRLKLENQTGSLTITDINTTDTGLYQLKIFSSSSISEKTFSVAVLDSPDKVKTISVKEGESVTFNPGVMTTPIDVMRTLPSSIGFGHLMEDSGLSSAAVAGICVGVVLLFVTAAAVGVIHYRKRPRAGQNNITAQPSYQAGHLQDFSLRSDPEMSPGGKETEDASETSL